MVDRAPERETGHLQPYSVPILQGDLEQTVKKELETQLPFLHNEPPDPF